MPFSGFQRNCCFLLLTLLLPYGLQAQEEGASLPQLTLSGYTDVYFSVFSDSLAPNALQQYTTVSPRDRRFGLNMAQLGANYQSEHVRGNFIFHFGDIAQATWSDEFRFVQEANVGVRLAPGLWLDAGFFATHIGTESFLPKNNLLSSTAVATYNEPFFQAGARLAWQASEKVYAEFWAVNGYNFFMDINRSKSFGGLLNVQLSERVSLTYTNLFGNEAPQGAGITQFRTYQNLYLNAEVGEKVVLVIGGDLGTQGNSDLADPTAGATMFNALATVRYFFTDQLSTTARFEIFQDRQGFISGLLPTTGEGLNGLELTGYTWGWEYRPMPEAFIRAETRYLQTAEHIPIFNNQGSTRNRWEVMLTMGFVFDRTFGFGKAE